jgi:hypothetical protein
MSYCSAITAKISCTRWWPSPCHTSRRYGGAPDPGVESIVDGMGCASKDPAATSSGAAWAFFAPHLGANSHGCPPVLLRFRLGDDKGGFDRRVRIQ